MGEDSQNGKIIKIGISNSISAFWVSLITLICVTCWQGNRFSEYEKTAGVDYQWVVVIILSYNIHYVKYVSQWGGYPPI